MADLKTGTTIGGAGIWHGSNLPLVPAGNVITYRGWKIYTDNDRPTAEEVGAVSLANGGTVAGKLTVNNNIDNNGNLTTREIYATKRGAITRDDGSVPYFAIVRKDLDYTKLPTSDVNIGSFEFRNSSANADTFGGKVLVSLSSYWKTDNSGRLNIDARQGDSIKSRLVIDGSGVATIDYGDFKVTGSTTLAVLNAASANVTGSLVAQTLTANDWTNVDARYMSGLPKTPPTGITSMADIRLTEKNDVWTIANGWADGPSSNNLTTYVGILVNYRRANNGSNSLTQYFYSEGTTYIRTGSNGQTGFTWTGSGTNGWRKVYDEANKPAPVDFNAVSRTGDTMSGALTVNSTITAQQGINSSGFTARPQADPSGAVAGDYLNTPDVKLGWRTRGGDDTYGFGHVSLYGQEKVNEFWAGVLSVNGYSKTSSYYFTHTGEFRAPFIASTNTDTYRIKNGNQAVFQRFDGTNWYFMLADSADGSYNALRPFFINKATGDVNMNHVVRVGNFRSNGDADIAGYVYTGNRASYMRSDGQIYGGAYGGFLTDWVNNNYYPRGDGNYNRSRSDDAWNKANDAQLNRLADWRFAGYGEATNGNNDNVYAEAPGSCVVVGVQQKTNFTGIHYRQPQAYRNGGWFNIGLG